MILNIITETYFLSMLTTSYSDASAAAKLQLENSFYGKAVFSSETYGMDAINFKAEQSIKLRTKYFPQFFFMTFLDWNLFHNTCKKYIISLHPALQNIFFFTSITFQSTWSWQVLARISCSLSIHVTLLRFSVLCRRT